MGKLSNWLNICKINLYNTYSYKFRLEKKRNFAIVILLLHTKLQATQIRRLLWTLFVLTSAVKVSELSKIDSGSVGLKNISGTLHW